MNVDYCVTYTFLMEFFLVKSKKAYETYIGIVQRDCVYSLFSQAKKHNTK